MKKIRIDPPGICQLLQATVQQQQQAMKTQSTAGIPIVASSQGFQMILPQPNKPSSSVMQLIQSNTIHQVDVVADANTNNIDVET